MNDLADYFEAPHLGPGFAVGKIVVFEQARLRIPSLGHQTPEIMRSDQSQKVYIIYRVNK